MLGCSDDEQKHRLNKEVVERSGCRFRIYRLPFSADDFLHPASLWTQFGRRLSRFKHEIEDRMPGYFTACPLRLSVREDAAINIAGVDDIAGAIEEILRSGMERTYFQVRTRRPLPVKDCLRMLAERQACVCRSSRMRSN